MESTITKGRDHELETVAECGEGKWIVWKKKQEQRLSTYEIEQCIIVSIINKEHGFLQHISISSQEIAEQALTDFLKWWNDRKDDFPPLESRLFVIFPDLTIDADQENWSDELLQKLATVVDVDPKTVDLWDLKKSTLSEVVVFNDGSGIMPAVSCNGQKINPAVPEFDSDG